VCRRWARRNSARRCASRTAASRRSSWQATRSTSTRTVHALGAHKPIDLFNLRRRYTFLAPLLDAEYGSALFVPGTEPAELDVRFSTTGVLIREWQP